jgi:hypothetical protein
MRLAYQVSRDDVIPAVAGAVPIPVIRRTALASPHPALQAGEGHIFCRPRESGDPEPAPGLKGGQPLLYEPVVQVPLLRILSLDHFELPARKIARDVDMSTYSVPLHWLARM